MNMAQNIAAGLDRILTIEVVRVTERAAVAAAKTSSGKRCGR